MMLIADILILPFSLWVAFSLRTGVLFIPDWSQLWLFVSVLVVGLPVFIKMGLYRAIVHYMELRAFGTIFKAVTFTVAVWGVMLLLIAPHGVPRSSVVIFWMLALLMVSGSRLWARWLLTGWKRSSNRPCVAVYGAGASAIQLVSALRFSELMEVVAFIDDDKELHGHEIAGLTVYSSDDLSVLIDHLGVEQVLIAIPSATASQKRIIFNRLKQYPLQIRILPGVEAIANGTVQLERVRDVAVEDLLGRDAVTPDESLLDVCIKGRVVMVTGAGGSIGSELCRQILSHEPESLLLFERNELALYTIERELRQHAHVASSAIKLIPLLGSVVDSVRLEHVCRVFGVYTIYHAAAYKHVPLVEFNPAEAIRNNIIGTMHTAQAAVACNVRNFVLISTDKAVRPTNVMGATKRFAEMVLQALSQVHDSSKTCFSMVRFGNVLGSSGSVVPLFRKQIEAGGPITVTHPEITRYFMSIPEAAQLVIQAGAMAEGGDVFILDMGKPVKIVDLARQMIHLSGLTVKNEEHPNGDVEISFSGLRPGEKLYEELLISDAVLGTQHPLIMRGKDEYLTWAELSVFIERLQRDVEQHDIADIRQCLLSVVNGYAPQCGIKDLLVVEI